jgi:uncharacterized membrane protein affecting hemolysin expression
MRFNYQEKRSILLILMTIVIKITPVMFILGCGMQVGQHPQLDALGTKTEF